MRAVNADELDAATLERIDFPIEVRCRCCGRLLCKATSIDVLEKGAVLQVKCPRSKCHWVNSFRG